MGAYGFPKVAEDAAHASGDMGFMALGVSNDANADRGANGDYTPIALTKSGNVKVELQSTGKATYAVSTAYFTPVATATDLAEIKHNGTDANRIIKIKRIIINYRSTTTQNVNNFFLVKRSTDNTSGTSATPTIVPLDSAFAGTTTATVKSYTANPTLGTLVGIMATLTSCGAVDGLATAGTQQLVIFDEHLAGGPIVLRASGQTVAVNNNGVTVPNTSPSISVTFYWTEE